MNKTAIKNFAIQARNKLIADISYRAGLMGITTEGISEALPQSTPGTEFYDIGTDTPYSISGDAIAQRRKLVEVIRQKERDSDYATAYKYIIEEVAYTWFNRLIAIRFMEVNDYLPSRTRVLSSIKGRIEPDIIASPFEAGFEFTDEEKEKILQLKTDNQIDKLFCILFIKQCNALNEQLSALFEKTNDYTELLLNISVIDQDGVVYKLVHDISEDDFNIEKGGQVEIIGWLYQYYNTEPKAEVFGRPSGTKIKKEDVPAATQLFTPDWIVRYMVENSLGRLWVEGHPNDELKSNWKYYLEEAEQEPCVEEKLAEIRKEYAELNPEDIKIIDPCMGSGHILVYAFDVLMQIYESAGYGQRDTAVSILKNNIYGLDIDERAFQLSYFAVMMKARQYNRRILNGEHRPNLYSIEESNSINRNHLKYFGMSLSESDREKALSQMNSLLDTFIDAKEYGSILTVKEYDFKLLERFVSDNEPTGQISLETVGIEDTKEALLQLIAQGKVLGQKYWVAVTNPPYIGISNVGGDLYDLVCDKYNSFKQDLYCVFMKKVNDFTRLYGYQAMITQQSFMFNSRFEKVRDWLLSSCVLKNLVYLDTGAFEEISGEKVRSCSFILLKNKFINYKSKFIDLRNIDDAVKKEVIYRETCKKTSAELLHLVKIDSFKKIDGYCFSYWLSNKTIEILGGKESLKKYAETRHGLVTGNGDLFMRLWYEVCFNNISFNESEECIWFPYNKGGSFRRWYGNREYIVNWKNDGESIRNYRDNNDCIKSSNYNDGYNFKENISWSDIRSGKISFRYTPKGALFDTSGPSMIMIEQDKLYELLGFLNTKVMQKLIDVFCTGLHYATGAVEKIPIIKIDLIEVRSLALECVSNTKSDWDSYETSWDFKYHPLVNHTNIDTDKPVTVENSYKYWKSECEQRFTKLKANEEELNRIFIDIYGLQDELTPEVLDKDITVHRVFDTKEDVPESMKGSAYIRTRRDEIVSLLSYAVGCMFGRYSLDTQGLAYAGGEWEASKYTSFKPVLDNIIPITDEVYLEDDIDIITCLCTWLKVVYSEDTLEENLDFIAKALGNKGNTSREIIRNYFLNDFFKDHCQTYSVTGSGKRPIYWLFDSGKQNGFKALIYLHRYNADTIGNLRIDYLHRMQRIYESEIERMQDTIDHVANARDVAAAKKRKEKLQKQLKECREYDEKIAHLALSRIELDLDDGVKVNYRKIQTGADGKLYEVLADSKNIMSKER